MGHIRRRDPADIRERALATAAQKQAEGCISCAASYLDLAREQGATEDEIARALVVPGARAASGSADGIGRRQLLRIAATAIVAGVAGNVLLTGRARAQPLPPSRNEIDYSHIPIDGFFGVDSSTSVARGSVAGMPLQYYIAELGATAHSIDAFDQKTAAYVTPAYTHGYWGVCGPLARPADVPNAAAFGQLQALAAIDAWNRSPTVGGRTLFADIEVGFGGWGNPISQADNVAMLNAFLNELTQAGFIPGVYITNYEKSIYYPADYIAPVPFVYWMPGGKRSSGLCAPCSNGCDTLRSVFGAWMSEVKDYSFGGMKPVLWQYWLSQMGCGGDFNYSPQSGYSTFIPIPVQAAAGTPTPTPVATNTGAP